MRLSGVIWLRNLTMFSNWFSGDECGQYCTSPHKQRMDQVGRRLLELRYANDVIHQHLHEWLRFSRHLEERGLPLPATGTDTVRQYLAVCAYASRTGGENGQEVTSKSCRHSPSTWRPPASPNSAGLRHSTFASSTRMLKNDGPRRSYGSTLRVFFRWAAVQGWLSSALRDAIPRPRQYRYVSLPDVLDQAEVDCILAAVDRTTPLGRRDYAVLVLAARYGLRPCDIRQLPLLPDVADALSAYLLDGRPASTNRPVFLRHCAPFEPFAAENNLATIMRD